MAGKRQAAKQLTHDNWADEEEAEEAGLFKQADEMELKTRVIKKAKRRGVTNTSDDLEEKPPLFTGFQGFGIPTPQNVTFSFNKSKEPPAAQGIQSLGSFPLVSSSNGDSKHTAVTKPASPQESTKMESSSQEAQGDARSTGDSGLTQGDEQSTADSGLTQKHINKSKFYGSLKSLNKSMMDWLQVHMEKNPLCYFTPVFKDYERHLASIKKRYSIDDSSIEFVSMSSSTTTETSNSPSQTVSAPSLTASAPSQTASAPSQTASAPSQASIATPPQQGASKLEETINITPINNKVTPSFGTANTASPLPTFSFGSTQKVQPETKASTVPSSNVISFGDQPIGGDKEEAGTTVSPMSTLFSFGAKSAPSAVKTDSSETKASENSPKPASTLFSFGANTPAFGSNSTTGSIFGPSSTTGGFMFAPKPATTSSAPLFSFGKPSESSGSVFGAGAAATSGFSFKAAVATAASDDGAASSTAAGGEEEEYVPPKPEVENKVTEDDALYTQRVKLFYEKEGKYVDKGVGNLYIKPLENGKNSLLVRADTNLGNILLNISLAESIPITRMGKNNVTLVCVANPPMDPKAKDSSTPTMLLVRVKTAEDADELLEKLELYKKEN